MKYVFCYILVFFLFCAFRVGYAQVVPVPNDDADNDQNQNLEILSEQNQDENDDYVNVGQRAPLMAMPRAI